MASKYKVGDEVEYVPYDDGIAEGVYRVEEVLAEGVYRIGNKEVFVDCVNDSLIRKK